MNLPLPLEDIFFAAMEMSSSNERAAYLDRVCADDKALRAKVDRMLAAKVHVESFLELPAQITNATGVAKVKETVEMQIGPYKLLEPIGEGGMGTVYMAEQTDPVHRRVALKLIKTGMDTKHVIARFEAERQALALMDHPNISKVYDAGSTESGHPYFVMELVKGKPITEFCDEQQLDTRSRLELFQQVCLGVQHAHQKGIIHRDIKPDNVLVALYDDRPVPKIIDFGVAKATGERLTKKTMFTGFGQIVGTLAYMSPEQAQFNQEDIDTRCDIYSLGAILYEILVGEPPFDRGKINTQALGETLRMIREDEPTKPSTKLSAIGQPGQNTSGHSSAKKLGLALRGELDWIVMKSIEKDRSRRYGTANDFATDIDHYLRGETVVAHPPSRSYRLKKFCRKYKGPVLAASLIGVALLAGIIGTAVGLVQAESQRQVADAQRDRAVEAERQASARANELEQVSDFQAKIFSQIDPYTTGRLLVEGMTKSLDAALIEAGLSESERAERVKSFEILCKNVNATDAAVELIDQTILNPAVAEIDKQFADQPVVAAKLLEVIATLYHDLGSEAAALSLVRRVLDIRRLALGDDHLDTIETHGMIGVSLAYLGRLSEAEPYVREAMEKIRRNLGEEHPLALTWKSNLGGILSSSQGPTEESEQYLREALEGRRNSLGDEDPETLRSMIAYAQILKERGRIVDAELQMRRAFKGCRRELGVDDFQTLRAVNELASILLLQGKTGEATRMFRMNLESTRRVKGEEHPMTVRALINFASALSERGESVKAMSHKREAVELSRRVYGDDHPGTLNAINNLGNGYLAQRRFVVAEALFRESLEKKREVLGSEHPDTLKTMGNLGRALVQQGKLDEAELNLREALDTGRRIWVETDPNLQSATTNFGNLLIAQGKYTETVELLKEVKERLSHSKSDGDRLRYGNLLTAFGKAQMGRGEFVAAEVSLLEAQHLISENRGASYNNKFQCADAFVAFYAAWDAAKPGEGYSEKQTEWKRKLEDLVQPESGDDAVKGDQD